MITLQTKRGPLELTDENVRSLKRIYLTKDVDTELARMQIKLLQKPSIRPVNFWLFVRNWMKKSPDLIRPEPVSANWWKSEQGTLEMATQLNLAPRPGEELAAFRQRLSERLKAPH